MEESGSPRNRGVGGARLEEDDSVGVDSNGAAALVVLGDGGTHGKMRSREAKKLAVAAVVGRGVRRRGEVAELRPNSRTSARYLWKWGGFQASVIEENGRPGARVYIGGFRGGGASLGIDLQRDLNRAAMACESWTLARWRRRSQQVGSTYRWL